MLLFLLSIGCSTPEKTPVDTGTVVEVVPEVVPIQGELLMGLQLARRISLDVRGKYCSYDEISQLEADPGSLDALIAVWLQDPGHVTQLRSIFSNQLLTRVDTFNVDYQDYYLDESQSSPFVLSVGEESVQLMAYIASNDLPWTDVVTADYTMANSLLLDIWALSPVDRVSTSLSDWVPARYTDGRPAGGVVMTNGIWWRHYTTPNNKSRARSAFLTKFLVCDDHLARTVTSPPNLRVGDTNLEDMVQTEPSCQACHITLDPVAATLYGFWQFDIHDVLELESYHPEREWFGERELNLEMSWYGKKLSAPVDLGPAIAADSRFLSCAVENLAKSLWRREIVADDAGQLANILASFTEHELRYSALFTAILATPEYQMANGSLDDSRNYSARKILQAEQIESVIADITGFVWTEEWDDSEQSVFSNDEVGFRLLFGGIDGRMTNKKATDPSPSRQLSVKRYIQLASADVVERVWNDSSASELFLGKAISDIHSDHEDFATIVGAIHLRVTGLEISAEQLQLQKDMFGNIERSFGRKQAWTTMTSVMLRNAEAWIY